MTSQTAAKGKEHSILQLYNIHLGNSRFQVSLENVITICIISREFHKDSYELLHLHDTSPGGGGGAVLPILG